MTATSIIATVIPVVSVALWFMARKGLHRFAADSKGIALQTVIVMVVLLAIAGGVAAVLLTRGGEAVSDFEDQDITSEAGDFSAEALCEAAGFSWSTNDRCY